VTKIHSSMPHLNGNVVAAVDFETSGTRAGFHEPIQIAVVILNSDLRPAEGVRPFYQEIKPLHPERADPEATRVHKLDLDRLVMEAMEPGDIETMLIDWWNSLELPFERRLVPLAHNWPFELSFFRSWLGVSLTDKLFHYHARDGMTYALGLNDKSFMRGNKALFRNVGLTDLCKHFGVVNPRPHDALNDALSEAEVYRHLLNVDVL
jgi:DNA polymerase III epsilon subunit-like protein